MKENITIGLIHALEESEEPIRGSFKSIWPEVNLKEYSDFDLSIDRANGVEESMIRSRIIGLGKDAVNDKVDAILYTCSAFGNAINAAKEEFDIPVLKPNESAFKAAIKAKKDVNILVTFKPSLDLLTNEFKEMSHGQGIGIQGYLIDSALDLLKDNRIEDHNQRILDFINSLPSDETIVLGQFSMARAAEKINSQMPNRLVLNTPDAAVTELKDLFSD